MLGVADPPYKTLARLSVNAGSIFGVHILKRMLTSWKQFRKELQELFKTWEICLAVRG